MIKSARFNRGIRTVIATATIAGSLTLAFTGSSFAASSRGTAAHTTRNNVRPANIVRGGTSWLYGETVIGFPPPPRWNPQTHSWYRLPYDPIFDFEYRGGLAYTGVDYLSNPVGINAAGVSEAAQSLEVYGKTNVLEGVNLYRTGDSARVAKLVQSLAAPSGANGVTVSLGSDPNMASDVITFERDGAAMGQPFSIPTKLVDAIDSVVHRLTPNCSDGHLSGPIEVVSTLVSSTGAPEAGRPVLLPCKETFPSKLMLEK